MARIALAVMAAALGILLFLAFDPRPVAVFTYQHPVPVAAGARSRGELVNHSRLRAGETVYRWDEWCSQRALPIGEVRGWLESEGPEGINEVRGLPVVATTVRGVVGCFTRTTGFGLPTDLAPGIYLLRAAVVWDLNEIRSVTVLLAPVRFGVVPSAGDPPG